ncbi:MAG: hypothetical protein ACO1OC_02770 [Tuberibacillus sp.]
MVMCHSFAEKFSADAKVLLERVTKQITQEHTLKIVDKIRETLKENDAMLKEIKMRADAFFGRDTFTSMQKIVEQWNTIPKV